MTTTTEADVTIQRAVRIYFAAASPEERRDLCLGECHLRTGKAGGPIVVLGSWSRAVLAVFDIAADGGLTRRPRYTAPRKATA